MPGFDNFLHNKTPKFLVFCLVNAISLTACSDGPWNNPYPPAGQDRNILYSSFDQRPNHLDPAQSYSSNEIEFTAQIYEPPLEYHYLKRPYTLIPLTAEQVPVPVFYNNKDQRVAENAPADSISYSLYNINIKPGIQYQPHPAFARDNAGNYLYHALTTAELEDKNELKHFTQSGSRELTADDYVYQIKRLAHPKIHSPILGLMSEYIDGLGEFSKRLGAEYDKRKQLADESLYLDLRDFEFPGVTVIDRYTYQIRIKGKYPQMVYWLAMPFFAPVPWEADRFYTQPGMKENNVTLDWYPVGTGPYMLSVNNPNREMILERNPNFHGQVYPSEGEELDKAAGLLADAGQAIPFIEKAIYKLEKESIPYWNKFLQGYYDTSGISSDSFDQAVKVGAEGDARLTPEMQAKGIRLATSIGTSTYYLGFNMLDETVGGNSERARKLRQALSIAIDYEEYISIFLNGRGISAQGPIPPGIFGYVEGEKSINPYVYNWRNDKPRRKSIDDARQLMKEAGYAEGIDPATGKSLILYFDLPSSGGPGAKAYLDWMRKQFDKLDIQLVFRNTDYNRFQEKMLKGDAQIYRWGWNADYPDPENFFFLLYGPNAKAVFQGENASNYQNAEFDALFDKMKNMSNGPARQQTIDRMVEMVRRDSPWIWGLHPKGFALFHQWYSNAKPNQIANNTLKYKKVDSAIRNEKRLAWNSPVLWPVVLLTLVFIVSLVPAVLTFRKREKMAIK